MDHASREEIIARLRPEFGGWESMRYRELRKARLVQLFA
jgi:hypothetical protein